VKSLSLVLTGIFTIEMKNRWRIREAIKIL
jgi:hypothetical protein